MSEETPTKVPMMPKLKFLGGGLVVGLLVGGIGAGKVWWDMSGTIAAQEQAASDAVTAAHASMVDLKAQAAKATQFESALRARISLSQAIFELDRRNFGTAKDRLSGAQKALSAVDPALLELDPEAYAKVTKEIGDLKISVATDLASQKEDIQEGAANLDALLKIGP